MPQSEALLTSTEAGALIGISGKTVVRRARAGLIPIAHELPGSNGALLFNAAAVSAYADECEARKRPSTAAA